MEWFTYSKTVLCSKFPCFQSLKLSFRVVHRALSFLSSSHGWYFGTIQQQLFMSLESCVLCSHDFLSVCDTCWILPANYARVGLHLLYLSPNPIQNQHDTKLEVDVDTTHAMKLPKIFSRIISFKTLPNRDISTYRLIQNALWLRWVH